MIMNYIVGDVEDFEMMPEGRFQAVIEYVQSKMYGNESPYEVIEAAFVIEDDELYGKKYVEKYFIGHPNETVQKIARSKLNKFAQEIGGIKKGEELKEDCFLYKKVIISIRHEVSKKDGKIYARLIGHELINTNNTAVSSVSQPVSHEMSMQKPQTGIVPPMANTLTNIALNDKVPF